MTDTEMLADVVVEAIKVAIAPRDAKIAALEQRIAELEARPAMKDAGVWKAGTVYDAGAIVSHGGSGWICSATHCAVGSEPSHDFFRLFVKAGRDGRKDPQR